MDDLDVMQYSKMKRLNYIDSIRGIAILMVILVHVAHTVSKFSELSPTIWLLTEYGIMGVQLFFVVSAFTLCLSYERRINEDKRNLKFFIRRYFRIAPAYYLIGILVYFLISYLLPEFSVTSSDSYTLNSVLSNVFLIHGFVLDPSNNLVPGGWSIGTEMAFYAIFPLLFFLSKRALNLNLSFLLKSFFIVIIGINIVTFVINLLIREKLERWGLSGFVYFNLYNQIPVFLVGICYYFLERKNYLEFDKKVDLVGFLGFTSLSLIIWKIGLVYEVLGYLISIIPFVTALSFIFLINLFRKVNKLNHTFLKRIGSISYSMYLIHFLFARSLSMFILSKVDCTNYENATLVLLFILTVILTYLMALISEKLIEKPFIKLGKKLVKKV